MLTDLACSCVTYDCQLCSRRDGSTERREAKDADDETSLLLGFKFTINTTLTQVSLLGSTYLNSLYRHHFEIDSVGYVTLDRGVLKQLSYCCYRCFYSCVNLLA